MLLRIRFLACFLTLLLTGCSLASFAQNHSQSFETLRCAGPEVASATVYVDSLGWHTGLVLAREDAVAALGELIPEFHRFPWVEIGWGDRDFYMASGYSYLAGFRALFFSRGSAVHAAGFSESPERFFDRYQLVRLEIDRTKLGALLGYIREHLELDPCGASTRLGTSLYGQGSFYSGRGQFSITHTCNSWTAGALIAAGCPIDAELTRASTLLRELRAVGSTASPQGSRGSLQHAP